MKIKKASEVLNIRKATIDDVKSIYALINRYARARKLLPRALSHIYDNVRDFVVCESKRKQIIACCALHVVWEDLGEIKSLVVKREYQSKKIGTALIKQCLAEAKQLGVKRIFALTYVPEFFLRNKFKKVNKNKLPAKVWRECIQCPHFPDCEEIAVLRRI